MDGQPLNLEKLLAIPHVDPYGGFEISPDGRQAAFSGNHSGRWELYTIPLEGSSPPRRITSGPGGKFCPRFSPDGRRLAYALDLDGSEACDIYVADLETGEHTNLTPGTPEAFQPNCSWSPDGTRIACISSQTGIFKTYLIPAQGGAGQLALDLPYPDYDVTWSPDGSRLAVSVEGRGQDHFIFIVPVEGGEARPVALEGEPINAKGARWSPDGRRLACASDIQGNYQVALFDPDDGEFCWVTGGEGDHEAPCWSLDGRQLACVHRKGPFTRLEVVDLVAGTTTAFQVEPGIHHAPRFTPDGARLIYAFENPRHPAGLWALDLAGGTNHQLTRSLPAELGEYPFVIPQEVNYPSLDGVQVPALLYRPLRSEGLPPGVIVIHGGPNWLSQADWYPEVQAMLSRGWVVLAPNYRGSTGYGREWQLANRFDLGGVDTRDVVAGSDYLVREGLVDPARLAVTGRSHGGYLTMTCLTQYPDRWAGGSAVVPFLNWFTAHANSRPDLQHWDLENFGDPEENYQLWYERSPYFFLERVKAPVQLICGANDPRCPASESVQAHQALEALGLPVDLALYPDEGHVFLKIENVVSAEVRRMAFLEQVLGKR